METAAGATSGQGQTVVLRGEPGIGKTTLLDELADSAGELHVLRATGVEAEGFIPLAALNMLLRPIIDAEGRLGTLLDGTDPPSVLALGSATLDALAEAAEIRPVLLLIDDGHWIDTESGHALSFALRRATNERASAVVAVRSGEASAFDNAGFEELELTGLSLEHAHDLIRHHDVNAGNNDPIAIDVLAECWRRTGGNPLALSEAVRSLDRSQRNGHAPLPSVITTSHRLTDALSRRLVGLPERTVLALAIVAASDGQEGEIAAALDLASLTVADLQPAEAAGVVVLVTGEIGLTHPLYRPAIAQTVGPSAMRAAHGDLARALESEPSAAARHLAAAAIGPDEHVAEALTVAGVDALARGAPTLAAQAFERASRLSVDPIAAFDRMRRAGRALWDASDPSGALSLLHHADALAVDDVSRAELAGDLGDVIGWEINVVRGVDVMVDAAASVEVTQPTTAALLGLRASLLIGLAGDGGRSFALAAHAMDLVDPEDVTTLIAGRAVRGIAAQLVGRRGLADEDLDAVAFVDDLPVEMVSAPIVLVLQAVAFARMIREEHDRATVVLQLVQRAARQLGQPGVLGFTGALASEIAFRRGRFGDAIAAADLDVSWNEGRTEPTAFFGHAARSRAEAVVGHHEAALQHADRARATATSIGMNALQMWAEAAAGLSWLGQGRPADALSSLRLSRHLASGYLEPSMLWAGTDLVDALIVTGHEDEALAVAEESASRATLSGTRWGRAFADRTRGWLADDADGVVAAVEAFGSMDAPFERARSLLVLGERFGRKEAARDAAAEFDRMGARPWADRAWASGHQTRPPQPNSILESLTSAEYRVAEAVARGLSNREVADELYLSPRTVDAHLRSIYPKLSVRGRSELAARWNSGG